MTPDKIKKLYSTMQSERIALEQTWRDCFDLTSPIHGQGLTGSDASNAASALTDASQRKAEKYDDTLADCARLLASSIIGGMTPANSRWIDLDVSDKPEYRSAWLDSAAETAWREIHSANFDSEGFDFVYSLIIGGWSPFYTGYDEVSGALRFEFWPMAQAYCAASKASGPIDTVIRAYQLTPEQIRNEYPGASTEALETIKQDSKPRRVLWAIYPRSGETKAGGVANNKPFASVHMLESGQLLRESGYDDFPLCVPRWTRIPASCYGVGPVYAALDTAKTLNAAVMMALQNAEMAIAGMYVAVDDGVFNPHVVNIGPREVVMVSDRSNFDRMPAGGDFNIALAEVAGLREEVRRIMMVQDLQPPQQVNMTATEFSGRMAIVRQLLGPVYGRLQAEWLKPMVERVVNLLIVAGKIPPPPEELRGSKLSVRFVSPMARSQRAADVSAMRQLENDLAGLAQIKPDVLDLYDMDKAQDEKAWLLGVPQSLMRDAAAVKKIRDERAKAQAEAMKQQQAMQMQAQQGAMPQ